jgi:MFS family permease
MTQAQARTKAPASPSSVAGDVRKDVLASIINMFCVGTMYALSIVQFELCRLFPNTSYTASYQPFGYTSFGLAFGVALCPFLMDRLGPRAIAACGTSIWGLSLLSGGYFLGRANLQVFPIFIGLGGFGVGYTYLAVITLMGQVLPPQSLLRSAIGPLGFSSGAGASIAASFVLNFGYLDITELGKMLQIGGIVLAIVGAVVLRFLCAPEKAQSQSKPGPMNFRVVAFYQVLLFFNALPGMVVFGALMSIASHHFVFDSKLSSPSILLSLTVALALGGLLSPFLGTRMGSRGVFMSLFGARAVLFLMFSQFPQSSLLLFLELAVVLFSHGAGFSLLPRFLKARLVGQNDQISHPYGMVLIAWGMAGIAAQVINTSLTPSSGDFTTTSLALGFITLACSTTISLLKSDSRGNLVC